MHVLLWQVYSILMLHSIKETSASCSLYCACKWKNGKQTVECINKNLLEIPEALDPETQVLDFSGNNITKLTKDLFMKKQLTNLQRIYLSKCKIKAIHKEAFKGLTNLVELDLSHNLLENVPSAAFANCPALMKLTLSSNPISSLKKFAFSHLSYLNTLELTNCEISDVEEGAFQGLHSLEWLHLDGNRMKTIQGRGTLPENVKGVELQKNAWECDCHIRDLYAWLRDFNIPFSEEPVCDEPFRLKGRAIKSIPFAELACLPDITPTTFFLELGEGKNVSLLCHVHAIPEASVSWWFQGQMLQNNSLVAPGVHLIYFVEEGTENKRSELFIYNAISEDNGTFICSAENTAGTTQSNFTIKIILKEDPIVIIVSFPFQYFIFIAVVVSALALLVTIVVIVLILRCRRRKRRRQQNREQTKEVTLQLQQNANKSAALRENIEALSHDPLKVNVSPVNCDDDVVSYGERSCEQLLTAMATANQISSPLSLRRYQVEQNPDLINGTETITCYREGGDGDCDDGRCVPAAIENERIIPAMPVAYIRGNVDFYNDMRRIVDPEGYPTDFGLPKMPCRTQCDEAYYRTLPCNRMKRHSAANPLKRFSREVEFLSRSVDTPYDHYHADIRYTADGYPARKIAGDNRVMFMANGENAAPASLPCCSVKWPACVPASVQPSVPYQSVTKRCVSAQTDTEDEGDNSDNFSGSKCQPSSAINLQNDGVNEVVTESPDEGYEGEPSVV